MSVSKVVFVSFYLLLCDHSDCFHLFSALLFLVSLKHRHCSVLSIKLCVFGLLFCGFCVVLGL